LTEPLLVEWGPHDVLTLTLNRPERRNAVDPELLAALARALRNEGRHAGAVILRGSGDAAFSAGYDLARLTGTESDLDADVFIGDVVDAMRSCPAPLIARLRGHCHGAGVELAMSCDLRIATPGLRMSVPAVSLGVVYRYQFVARMVAVVGLHRTADLLLGMRELDAETAREWGMLTEVVPASEIDSRVRETAERLASAPRAAVRGTKAGLNLLLDRGVAAVDVAEVQRLRAAAAASPERHEALQRRRARR
jgi:enoyl-CoA hydratase/carnithine racemase